jgi:Protein of unknown function (DUF4236)/Bacterial SH3 domain
MKAAPIPAATALHWGISKMALRFRRSVRLFPGVRLNFSRSGISTSIGVRGASLTLGNRGTYVNVGIPGTGLSYRSKVSPSRTSRTVVPPEDNALMPVVDGGHEIRSADINVLTSSGLGELKQLIHEAVARRNQLNIEKKVRVRHLWWAKRRLSLARIFIIRLFTQAVIEDLARKAFDREREVDEILSQLDGCVIDVDFGLDDATLQGFARAGSAFDEMCGSTIWDITSAISIDRAATRSAAGTIVNRRRVYFDRVGLDVLRSIQGALHLANANGNDIYLYTGFAIVWQSRSDFALIDIREFNCGFSYAMFTEEEGVPPDGEIAWQTWKLVNKDGSRDRRFNNNYQIPVVKYGHFSFFSTTGVNEAYHVSSYAKASEFAAAFTEYQAILRKIEPSEPAALPEQDGGPVADDVADQEQTNFVPPPRPKFLVIDGIVGATLIAAIAIFGPKAYSTTVEFLRSAGANEAAAIVPQVNRVTQRDEPVAIPAEQNRETVRVTSARANVRRTPSLKGVIVARLTRGTKLNVFARQGDWIQVGDDKPTGWINHVVVVSGVVSTYPKTAHTKAPRHARRRR